jgi:hypothetical protein
MSDVLLLTALVMGLGGLVVAFGVKWWWFFRYRRQRALLAEDARRRRVLDAVMADARRRRGHEGDQG